MNEQIISALISMSGVIVSGLISWFVSRSTASHELKKQEQIWAHDAIISSDEELSLLASAVAKYTQTVCREDQQSALEKIAVARSKETGALALALDALYTITKTNDVSGIDRALSEVFNQKRKASRR